MEKLKILAVGDVLVDRKNSQNPFDSVNEILASGDVVFGNCEGVYAKEWQRAPSSGVPLIADPTGIAMLAKANFTVMSLANNHSVDGGHTAMLTTQELLHAAGIKTCGAGGNFELAHQPALIDRCSQKVAILAYTAVFPHGYEARKKVPGLAVLRAHTLYTPWEVNEWNPGLLPRITTVPFEQDYQILREDIALAKAKADIVIVSIHWGDFTRPFVLTDHERRTARVAIAAGADIILGHHHHLIRGIEYYQGKPIFYGLGHFVFDLPHLNERLASEGYLVGTDPVEAIGLSRRFGEHRIHEREGYPLLPFHPDARLTFIASFDFKGTHLEEVNIIPCVINENNFPQPLKAEDPRIEVILNYLRKNCELEALATKIVYRRTEEMGNVQFQILPCT